VYYEKKEVVFYTKGTKKSEKIYYYCEWFKLPCYDKMMSGKSAEKIFVAKKEERNEKKDF